VTPDYSLSSVMPAAPTRRKRWPLYLLGAVLVAALAGGGLYLFLPGSIVVHGDLRLFADPDSLDTPAGGVGCQGRGGYADLHEGTPVTVTGPDGAILGVGRLGRGERLGSTQCRFSFAVEIPAGKTIYAFSTSDQRGGLKLTEDEILSRGVHLQVGG
jgi:hypothetical protein